MQTSSKKKLPMTDQISSSEVITSIPTRPSPRLVRGGVGATLVAIAAVVGTWLVATAATGGLAVDQGTGPQEVGLLAVVGFPSSGVWSASGWPA